GIEPGAGQERLEQAALRHLGLDRRRGGWLGGWLRRQRRRGHGFRRRGDRRRHVTRRRSARRRWLERRGKPEGIGHFGRGGSGIGRGGRRRRLPWHIGIEQEGAV